MGNKYLKGFLAGSLVGVAAGIMIIPQMNSKTRKQIVETGKNIMNTATEMMPGMHSKH